MKFLPLIAVLALVACGVDGPPVSPRAGSDKADTPKPGLTISGEAQVGVVTAL